MSSTSVILLYTGPSWPHRGLSWGHLGAILGSLGAILRTFLGHLGPSWPILAALGRHLGHFGALLGRLGNILCQLFFHIGPNWSLWGSSWSLLGAFLARFGSSLDSFGATWGSSWGDVGKNCFYYLGLTVACSILSSRSILASPVHRSQEKTRSLRASSPRGASAGTRSDNN